MSGYLQGLLIAVLRYMSMDEIQNCDHSKKAIEQIMKQVALIAITTVG